MSVSLGTRGKFVEVMNLLNAATINRRALGVQVASTTSPLAYSAVTRSQEELDPPGERIQYTKELIIVPIMLFIDLTEALGVIIQQRSIQGDRRDRNEPG